LLGYKQTARYAHVSADLPRAANDVAGTAMNRKADAIAAVEVRDAPRRREATRWAMKRPHTSPSRPHIWELPNEAPATLAEIFAAEDSRRQNLVLYEFRKVDGFRRCWEAIDVTGNPYGLIDAVTSCISSHLNPLNRLSVYRDKLRDAARCAEAAAGALERLSSAIDRSGRAGWSFRLKEAELPDPTDPRAIEDLRNMATGLESMLARGAFKDKGGRSRMAAFERLIDGLARVFEQATGRAPTVTRNHYPADGYGGRFLDFVEVVRPIASEIVKCPSQNFACP
jgi:hypothetical protein